MLASRWNADWNALVSHRDQALVFFGDSLDSLGGEDFSPWILVAHYSFE